MFSDVTIRVDDLGKGYQVYARPQDRLKQLVWRARRRYFREVQALDGVSFVVRRGETVGVVGQNGSGKSTLLQILTGTVRPTRGVCEIRGRVAALLELGAGFDPEFTGRENVYLNAAVLGLRRIQVQGRLAAIAAFADIGEFFDRPVKTYSSGMYIRLAFAVAVTVEPDVLLIDEVLAVGDLRFQMKCLDRMRALQQRGVTILFVSHSVEQVRRFCQRCLWLDKGRVVMDGPAATVTDRYNEYMTALSGNGHSPDLPPALPAGLAVLARIHTVELSSETLGAFDPLRVTVEYEILEERLPTFLLGVALYTLERGYVFGPNTSLDDVQVPATRGRHRVTYVIPRLPLLGGTYMVDVGLFVDRGLACLDYRLDAGRFVVHAPYFTEGLVHIEHRWEVGE
jgi:ABC-type polysaccharide/polyol phosphate transport system ATPase subunit